MKMSPLKSFDFRGLMDLLIKRRGDQKVKVSGSPPKLAMVAVALRK